MSNENTDISNNTDIDKLKLEMFDLRHEIDVRTANMKQFMDSAQRSYSEMAEKLNLEIEAAEKALN